MQEYSFRVISNRYKNYFSSIFVTGLPNLLKKMTEENKWSLYKKRLQGSQLIDALRQKYKNKPELLESETGQSQYQGHLEGAQSDTYYLLRMQGKEFVDITAGYGDKFNKVAQYEKSAVEEYER
jgi:transcription initiation factor TFIIF subunit alpha